MKREKLKSIRIKSQRLLRLRKTTKKKLQTIIKIKLFNNEIFLN